MRNKRNGGFMKIDLEILVETYMNALNLLAKILFRMKKEKN